MQQNEFDYNKSVFEQRWPDVDLHYNLDLAIKVCDIFQNFFYYNYDCGIPTTYACFSLMERTTV